MQNVFHGNHDFKKTLNVSYKIHVAMNSTFVAILYIQFSVTKPIYIHNHHHYPKHQFEKQISTTGQNNTQRLSTVSGPDFNKALPPSGSLPSRAPCLENESHTHSAAAVLM